MLSDRHYRSHTWATYSREQHFELYEAHNPGALNSRDPMKRVHGSCGCGWCQEFRRQYPQGKMAINRPGKERAMGSINVCDRCGALVKGNALGSVDLVTSADPASAETIEMEVCPACVADLVLLLENPVGDRERAYGDPWKREKEGDAVDSATAEQLAAALLTKLMRGQKSINGTVVED